MPDLSGKRIVVTRSSEDFDIMAQLVRQAGAIPISFPTIKILYSAPNEAIRKILNNLEKFDWLVLTSAKGVDGLTKYLDGQTLPQSLKVAAVGPKTAEAIRAQGWRIDFVPKRYLSKAILPGLGKLKGKRVLIAQGQLAESDLTDAILASGAKVSNLLAYITEANSPGDKDLARLRDGVDAFTFTSASSVINFINIIKQANIDIYESGSKAVFACIGPVTAAAAEQHNLSIQVVADEHTLEGLISALEHYYSKESIRVHNE